MGAQYGGALFCNGVFAFVDAQFPTGTTPYQQYITCIILTHSGKGAKGNV